MICFVRVTFYQHEHIYISRCAPSCASDSKLEKLAEKVAKLEQELKVAKMQLKHTAEQLVAEHKCDQVTDKISLAFTRLK